MGSEMYVKESILQKDEQITKVLLVDDQLIVAEAFKRLFNDVDDVEIHTCLDPMMAVSEARRIKPTVILQDLNMPGMSGLMLLSAFKSNPDIKNVPVIVLSGEENPEIKSEAFSVGACDYLVKFPDQIETLARIRAHSRSYLAQLQRDVALRALRDLKMELERKNKELETISCRDGLTGVLNRRGFDDYLAKEWLRASREGNELGLVLIDVDNFKAYNDNYGHQAGDECLRRVASAFGISLKRPSDIVARYGGEEFALILPETGVRGSLMLAETLRIAVESLRITHDYSSTANYITVSMGACIMIPQPGKTSEEMIFRADKALYGAKNAGRNCVRFFNTAKRKEEQN